MNHELEHLVNGDGDGDGDDETLAFNQPDGSVKLHQVIVEYHIVYPPVRTFKALSRFLPIPDKFKVIKAEFQFPSGTSFAAARDHAISLFPEGHPMPDFSHVIVSYYRNHERFYILDTSADLCTSLEAPRRIEILNDADFFDKRAASKSNQYILKVWMTILAGLGIFLAVVVFLALLSQ